MNGSDCGMFCCKFADYIAKGKKEITFEQVELDSINTKVNPSEYFSVEITDLMG